MIAEDRQEKERVDARNALEEYVYELRAKLSDEDQLATFVTEKDRETLCRTLDETENWLYEEGEECHRQVYSDRLSHLKSQGEPIRERRVEFEGRNAAIEELAGALQIAKKGLDYIRQSATAGARDEGKYSHLTEEEVRKVEKAVDEKWAWLEEKRAALSTILRTQQPPVTVAQIRAEKQALDSVVLPILNKPKPKADPPKEEKSKEKTGEDQKSNQNSQGDGHSQNNQQSNDDKMDVE